MEAVQAPDAYITSSDNFELANIGRGTGLESTTEFGNNGAPHDVYRDSPNIQELAPVDSGRQAWTFCASAFVLETLVWGFGFT